MLKWKNPEFYAIKFRKKETGPEKVLKAVVLSKI